MAGKKKEVKLQVAVTNQEQWDHMLATKGLTVVDVHQQWCGPCQAVLSLFRKIKNELGDDLLHFAMAEADSVDTLKGYRGNCEPTFLFYAGGELVGVLRGANGPLLQKMVVEELAQERKVLEQGGERRVVTDEALTDKADTETTQVKRSEEEVPVPAGKPYTVALIKPDAVAHGKAPEILMTVQDAGFEILAQEERALSRAEAEHLYEHRAAEPYFEELVQHMSSGPCLALLVSRPEELGDVVLALREFIGPPSTEEARRLFPNSVRAQFGSDAPYSAVHSSANRARASRELELFFPTSTLSLAEYGPKEDAVERTLALILAPVPRESRDEILQHIHDAGFSVAVEREAVLTEEEVRLLYREELEEDYFPTLLGNTLSGPLLALVLVGPAAVQRWKTMLGPKDVEQAQRDAPDSLGARFAVSGEALSQLYGSRSAEDAEREIQLLFPAEQTLAFIKPDAMQEHRGKILEEIQRSGFNVVQAKEMVLSASMAGLLYRGLEEQPFFNMLVKFMCSGPSMVLVLSRYNAVEEWRVMMGPTNPSQAMDTAPGSLRARFSKDILQNAVHGSSNAQRAAEEIRALFRKEPHDEGGRGSEQELSQAASEGDGTTASQEALADTVGLDSGQPVQGLKRSPQADAVMGEPAAQGGGAAP
ncbi:thioredoxin domain-containing protein 3 homolog isoform X2 [Scleropages formosus]|uniref:thioredoxin domain-containing protein 3 homolog isoform X2 n=1 Tax=Scleropages formosus TaxID=113540 RepID=UPI00087850F3|nr:thioredoxin domain-containing protein 3 homolog isoform X2 [Scleropages formosus]